MGRNWPPAKLPKSIAGYIALLLVTLRLQSKDQPDRLARAFKLVGSAHSLLCATLAARDVLHPKWKERNLIFHLDEESNSLIALEVGYLLVDTIALLLAKRIAGFPVPRRVLVHHLTYLALLSAFLEFATRSAEKGVFFVEAFLIMNASTPVLNLQWLLARSRASSRSKRILTDALDVLLLAVYATTRIGLLWKMIATYAERQKTSTLQAFMSIPLQCKTGTLAIGLVNSYWLAQLARQMLYRRSRRIQ